MVRNGREWPGMAGNDWGCSEMAGDGQKWPKMAGNGREWPGKAGKGRGWPRMAEDGRGWSEMAGDGWERMSYDLFPDGLYAKDLKRGALALRDFSSCAYLYDYMTIYFVCSILTLSSVSQIYPF